MSSQPKQINSAFRCFVARIKALFGECYAVGDLGGCTTWEVSEPALFCLGRMGNPSSTSRCSGGGGNAALYRWGSVCFSRCVSHF